MAQTYTLEEAAQRLSVPVEEFKRRLKTDWKTIRSFRDGPTLRFRAADIDELARSLGEASDPGLQLGKPGSAPTSSNEFLLPDDLSPLDGSSEDIFSVAAGDSGKSKKPKSGSDSDVRLEKTGAVDNDDSSELNLLTEEISLDLSGPGSSAILRSGGSGARLGVPKSGPNLSGPASSTKIPGPPASNDLMGGDSSSEFELSLDADSDSFELQLNDDASEEIDLGGSVERAVPGRKGQSGINLGKPADSGVSLEKTDDEDSDDFELSLDPEPETPSSRKLAGPKSVKVPQQQSSDSDSEFELTLDDNSGITDSLVHSLQDPSDEHDKGDIFETDFELPVVADDADSGSEVVAVESSDTDLENSDFDLALDESDIEGDDDSASQVVLLDDEPELEAPKKGRGRGLAGAAVGAAAVGAAAAAAAARKKKKKSSDEDDVELGSDELETGDSASGALRGVSRRTQDDDEDATPTRGYTPPAKWGPLPAIVLLPCLLLTFLGGIMSFDLLKGMWGYHQGSKPTGGLVREIAKALDMDPKD